MPASCYNELWGEGSYSKDAAAETDHRLQETSGTSFADSSGNGRTGTGNAAVTSVTGPTGYLPNAVQFGSPYYIALPAINETWTEGTIAVWAKPKSPMPDWAGLVVVRNRFTLHVRDDKDVRYNWSGASPEYAADMAAIPDWDEWYRLVLTVDSTEAKIYSNGSLLGTNTLAHPSSDFTGWYVRLGHDLSARYFNGDMAHAAMFSKKWNDTERAEDLAGPEPLNTTAGTVQVQSGDPVVGCILEVGTAPTYNDRNNGTLTITYRWFVNDVYQSTGSTFNTVGLSVGDVIKYQSRGTNNGDYDPAEDTDSSNSITLIDFLCLNQIFGEGSHTADSRLNSWINGDSDDNGTGDVLDAIGSLDGSWSGTPAYATGIKNHYKSLDLSGSNYVTLATGTSYFPDPNYNNFSVCLRFNADSLTGKQVLWETGGAQVCQVLHLDGTTLYALTAGSNVAVSTSVTVGSGDHSVVMTVDDDVLTLYVDDQEPVTAAVATIRSNAGSNAGAIGRANTLRYADQSTADSGAFSGLISDVATFIGVLNQYEAAHYIAGYEPLNTAAGSIGVQGGGSATVGSILEVDSAATYDDRNNGSVVVTYRWFVNDVYDSTSATFDTTGLSVDDVVKFYSRGTNDGGYDEAEDTVSSNTITLLAAPSGTTATPTTATLTTTTYAPTATTPEIRTPTTVGLVLTTYEPTIVASDHQSVTPTTIDLTTTPYVPSIQTPITVVPSEVDLTLTTYLPTIETPVQVTPDLLALSITTYAPNLELPVNTIPSIVELVLTSYVPTIELPVVITPSVIALNTTTYSPTVTASDVVVSVPATVELTTTGYNPTVVTPNTVVPTTRALTLTEYAPSVTISDAATFTPSNASLSLTTYEPTIVRPVTVTPTTVALTLTEYSPTVDIANAVSVVPETGTLELTTNVPTVTTTALVQVTPTTVALTLTTNVPTVTGGGDITISPESVELNISSYAPSVETPIVATPIYTELVISTFGPTITNPITITATTAELVLTTYSPSLSGTNPSSAYYYYLMQL